MEKKKDVTKYLERENQKHVEQVNHQGKAPRSRQNWTQRAF